jgi:hypothetical protein
MGENYEFYSVKPSQTGKTCEFCEFNENKNTGYYKKKYPFYYYLGRCVGFIECLIDLFCYIIKNIFK